MTNDLTELRASLEQAIDLIDASLLLPVKEQNYAEKLASKSTKLDFSQARSLLDKCDNVNQQYNESKPVIRIIHHFACSGGTLISKCLSAMPNVFLLSEVHPHSDLQRNTDKPQYSPSDVARLTMYAGIPEQKELAKIIFLDSINKVYRHIQDLGGTLVLREHSHSDYCVGEEFSHNTVAELLSKHFSVNSVVTLRNPVDSYLALLANGWAHFKPSSFNEYCRRVIAFLKPFSQDQVVSYESFVQRPEQTLERMCSILEVQFDSNFEDIYDIFSVTGDSGRVGNKIKPRARRECSEQFLLEVKQSEYFRILKERFGYE
jgi:hypothetical protein